jgi:hypothetical protein
MTNFDGGAPRAVPRHVKFPFCNHRTLAQTREICAHCGVKLSPWEWCNGVLCAKCRAGGSPDAA